MRWMRCVVPMYRRIPAPVRVCSATVQCAHGMCCSTTCGEWCRTPTPIYQTSSFRHFRIWLIRAHVMLQNRRCHSICLRIFFFSFAHFALRISYWNSFLLKWSKPWFSCHRPGVNDVNGWNCCGAHFSGFFCFRIFHSHGITSCMAIFVWQFRIDRSKHQTVKLLRSHFAPRSLHGARGTCIHDEIHADHWCGQKWPI